MDTSDSEYFESADEDIQSDQEICDKEKKKNNITKDFDSKEKLQELEETCTPKIEIPKTKENVSNELLKIEENNDVEKRNEVTECDRKSKNKDITQITSKVGSIAIKNESIESLSEKENTCGASCKVKEQEREATKKSRSCIKTKLGSKISKNAVKFEMTPEKKSSKEIEKEDVKYETEEKKNTFLQVEDNKLEVDENIWDDEELDWGTEDKLESEAKHDISQKNVARFPSPTTRNDSSANMNIGKPQVDSWGGWGTWGVSVLSTATQSVSSITSQLTNVIETGLGVVDPEELAKINTEEKRKFQETLGDQFEQHISDDAPSVGFGLGNLVKLVENTGTKVISGGLDTLETIGKKTMEVLQEGDPGLKKKRAFLKIEQNKPVLSQILREAKERAESESSTEEVYTKIAKNYETLFDDHHGLVHLEALELLSRQCEIKLKNIQNSSSGQHYTEFLETMDQIKELCELPDEEEEEQISISEITEKLEGAVAELNVQISYEKLVANWEETEVWLGAFNLNVCDEKELHQQAIETLAQITSLAMEQFHKIGELLLIKDRRSTADEADSLVQVTTTLTSLIGIVAAKFSEKLNSKICESTNKEISELITNVFFEAANSSSYIQDALQLLIPVLQVGAV